MPDLSDRELVKRVQAGDATAFNFLFDKYKHKISSLVSRFVDSHHDVEDIVQESFIKAYKALPKFRGDSEFYTWLYRIASNTAKNHLAARSRKPTSDFDPTEESIQYEYESLQTADEPGSLLARDQLEEVIKGAIQDLEANLRTAVTLREYGGLSYEQIAQIMDCPLGTVRSRIFRARSEIAEKIDAWERDEN